MDEYIGKRVLDTFQPYRDSSCDSNLSYLKQLRMHICIMFTCLSTVCVQIIAGRIFCERPSPIFAILISQMATCSCNLVPYAY